MNEKDLKIVRVVNPYDFDFDGELGARYGGRDFLIPAGGSLLTPLSVGEHLAKHLAQAKLLLDEKKRVPQPGDETRKLWDDASLEVVIKSLLKDELTQEKPVIKSEDDIMADKIKELNKVAEPEEDQLPDAENADGEETPEGEEGAAPVVYKDKAQVIAELKKRNVTFDPRAPKATLEALLK